jgi:hypothetical protein
MNRFLKPIQAALMLMILAALSSCTLGQAASPTPTAVDVNAIMTSAAATAFVELTKIAGQASPTPAPTQTPTLAPATKEPVEAVNTPDAASAGNATSTVAAGGLPPTETLVATAVGGTPGPTAARSLTPIGPAVPTSNAPTCLNSKYVDDVSIPDGTIMAPYQKFHKIWRIQNTGICSWDQGFGFALAAGEAMGSGPQYFSNNDQPVGPGGIVDIGVEMRAPSQPGEYIAHWKMISDSGQFFGGDFTVVIKVQ